MGYLRLYSRLVQSQFTIHTSKLGELISNIDYRSSHLGNPSAIRKHRCTNQTAVQGRENSSNIQTRGRRLLATFNSHHTRTRAETAISLCRQLQTFTQLLALPLANPQVPDLPTAKIKTTKIFEIQIWSVLQQFCTHENFQSYGTVCTDDRERV